MPSSKTIETTDEVVSFASEELILVNENDEETGYLDKAGCHKGSGILHRAFSIFLFNDNGELLLQQRSDDKPLWPLFWSNTCCSHPRRGETMELATQRRLQQELGMKTTPEFLYKFQYQAQYDATGAEHELCSVYLGHSSALPVPNRHEIADWRYISSNDLNTELASHPERFTPWFKLEWQRLNTEFNEQLARYTGPLARQAAC